jgi:hypothetical protein
MKSDETLFYQLTTSAIANMPLPKSVYYFMRLAEQLKHIKEGIKFRHFGWTRSRNYGLIQMKLPAEEVSICDKMCIFNISLCPCMCKFAKVRIWRTYTNGLSDTMFQ